MGAIRDLLPGKAGDPGRSGESNRLFVDAVLCVLKTGVPWEGLPARFGKGNTVWGRFDRWRKRGGLTTKVHALTGKSVRRIADAAYDFNASSVASNAAG